MTFSAINEVSIPQDTVTEPSSQAHWPTVQENPSQVQMRPDHTLKNMSCCRRIMERLFQNSCSTFLLIRGLRNSSQKWESFDRCLTGKQFLSDELLSQKGKTGAAEGESDMHSNEITYCNWQ